jgi:hypothetical protein
MKLLLQRSIFILLLLLVCKPVMAGSFIDEIEGVYAEKHLNVFRACISCEPEWKPEYEWNCLVIKKHSDHEADVFLNTSNEYGVCSVNERFTINDGSLFAQYKTHPGYKRATKKSDGLRLNIVDEKLWFTTQPESHEKDFCSNYENFDQSGFDAKDKQPLIKVQNVNLKYQDELQQYCPANTPLKSALDNDSDSSRNVTGANHEFDQVLGFFSDVKVYWDDDEHFLAIKDAIETSKADFLKKFIIVQVKNIRNFKNGEGESKVNVMAIDSTTGIVYPLPFEYMDGYPGDNNKAKLKYNLTENKLCVSGVTYRNSDDDNWWGESGVKSDWDPCYKFDGFKFHLMEDGLGNIKEKN